MVETKRCCLAISWPLKDCISRSTAPTPASLAKLACQSVGRLHSEGAPFVRLISRLQWRQCSRLTGGPGQHCRWVIKRLLLLTCSVVATAAAAERSAATSVLAPATQVVYVVWQATSGKLAAGVANGHQCCLSGAQHIQRREERRGACSSACSRECVHLAHQWLQRRRRRRRSSINRWHCGAGKRLAGCWLAGWLTVGGGELKRA